jgi:hypothetical protein
MLGPAYGTMRTDCNNYRKNSFLGGKIWLRIVGTVLTSEYESFEVTSIKLAKFQTF